MHVRRTLNSRCAAWGFESIFELYDPGRDRGATPIGSAIDIVKAVIGHAPAVWQTAQFAFPLNRPSRAWRWSRWPLISGTTCQRVRCPTDSALIRSNRCGKVSTETGFQGA